MIDSYSFGEIVVDGHRYNSDLVIFPDKIEHTWWRKQGHKLSPEDIKDAISVHPDTLIVGCGASGVLQIPAETREFIASLGIELMALPTDLACKNYNELAKDKKVVALLHLTC